MPKYDTATPFVAAYVLLRNGNKIAFVLRQNTAWMNDFYGLPSGKVEWHEPFSVGAIREAEEEVGVNIQPGDLTHAITIHRHSRETEWVDVYFEVAKWDGEVVNAEPHMHAEVAWLDIDNLPDNVIPSVAFALEQIKEGNKYAEYGWEGEEA